MKTKHLILLMVTFAVLFTACEDFLVKEPRLSQSNELTLSTYKGLDNATGGVYSQLCGYAWYGSQFVITADMKGGNAKRGSVISGRYTDEYLWNNTPASTSGLWATAYSTIAKANNVLEVIDGGFTEAGVEEAQLNVLRGECLFMRGLAYFDLARMYCQPYSAGTTNLGVPVVLVTENGYPARNTVGETYDRVVADLKDAIALLPVTNKRGDDAAYATKVAAQALLAKVYLYMENWAEAASYATTVIGTAGLSLFTADDYTTWDNKGYWGSGGPGKEIIFQVDGSEGNSSHPWWDAISYMMDPGGYGDCAASLDVLNLYEAGDVRADLFLQPDDYPGEYWSLKYPGRLGRTPHREFNVPVLRLAEMYLIRAEAILNGASVAGATALDDYNAIRTNRGLAAAGAVTLSDIYAERRRELCFEGNELFDLARTQRSLVRNDYTGLSNKDIPFTAGGTALVNYKWAMPIPQAEIDANVNCEQNPGY
ncbi:MAG TPA: RagB/SusD family nutrient uptake outer membrane protein [Bacteroidales bacterium]|nr:RagB/SusD family nutrient uptake outer membrane protein [Bacteroidales bacterium]HPK85267.1 RagB/SusD family nutrient uptake outer membrane protein [Bacteroidales bacterium]